MIFIHFKGNAAAIILNVLINVLEATPRLGLCTALAVGTPFTELWSCLDGEEDCTKYDL